MTKSITGLVISTLYGSERAEAQGLLDPILAKEPGEIHRDDIAAIITNFIELGLAFASAIAIIFIIISGYQYVLAAGNPEKLEKAKMGFTWSIVGFILAASAYALVYLLESALLATNATPAPSVGVTEPATTLEALISLFLAFAGAASIFYMILGGYRYVMSQGNKDLVESAKKTVSYAAIGLIFTMVSYVGFLLVRDSAAGNIFNTL